jgi:hypothetical protein
METPRLLSEYCAARAQSDGRISANAIVDVAIRIPTTNGLALRILETTWHLYSALLVKQPPFGRGSPG